MQFTEEQSALFARMDAKIREVIERRFHVSLDSGRWTSDDQAAWSSYQIATEKLIRTMESQPAIGDAAGYAAGIARLAISDCWRKRFPDWHSLKNRLRKFLKEQAYWEIWETDQHRWICSPRGWKDRPRAKASRVAELREKPRRIEARALPKQEILDTLGASDWDKLLDGCFRYLEGPIALDDLVSITGGLFGVKGAREISIEEMGGPQEDGPAWEPATPATHGEAPLAIQAQLKKIWQALQSMDRRWATCFILNPPGMKGAERGKPRDRGSDEDGADKDEARKRLRGQIDVLTSNGITTLTEIESLIGFTSKQYAQLWRDLALESRGCRPLDVTTNPVERFAAIWKEMPLDDDVIARALGLADSQKVINLRNEARKKLVTVLVDTGILEKKGSSG